MTEPAVRPAEVEVRPPAVADPASAMASRFGLLVRWFARRFFRHLDLRPETVERLRQLESRGSVVYVMRYASRLDYLLFNALFLRTGLRLSGYANGLRFDYYAPLFEWLRRARRAHRERARAEAPAYAQQIARAGESMFLFLRTERLGGGSRRAALRRRAEESALDQIVSTVWSEERPVFLVPLALFWRKGPRSERRFLNLTYGAPHRPSDVSKVMSFLTTYRGLYTKVGEPIDLRAFVSQRRSEGQASVIRKVRRTLLIFLFREEKVVEGPTLRARHRVQELVLQSPRVREAIRERAQERGVPEAAARLDAEKVVREIAANMNSTFLAILDVIAGAIFRRMFASIEVNGLEKVAEYAKRHPVVLMPNHRSYFDFLILSWLFYRNHLVPPHIAARENMGFGPFGFIFRRAGAFFLRRSFDDPLYKEVFRSYIGYLVREGFTQEFFIEGGRSRTGKMLAPRLGMLAWDVEAFVSGGRRDLFLIPIAITYEHLVEEQAMLSELGGARKKQESVLGLVRARKFLRRRFGSVYVNLGEPISLAAEVGARRAELAAETPEGVTARRRFVEDLGARLVQRINWATVPNATSVAACALLGEPRRGMFRHELALRMQEVVDLLTLQDVRLTPALLRDRGEFRESISTLLRSDLIRSVADARGEILYFEESRRLALDLYRNAILHYLVAPSFLARRLLRGPATRVALRDDLAEWLDLFYVEFFTPRAEILAAHLDGFLDAFVRSGHVEHADDELRATGKGRSYLQFLSNLTQGYAEAYYVACCAVLASGERFSRKQLEREMKEQFERALLLGEVEHREASNPVTFGNALEQLVHRKMLERLAPEPGREAREIRYARGARFDSLPALRERLAAAIAAR
ncbi:MAG: 1-acyl-sn-glycerol-3-phosphate acyltransferase [Deltaproteobacteria bacterium]|nr:MAG: 1-acyl-sn-glycerol-3-phosphate acyltransferase [Deltaproteobacteria bacterium]